MRCSRLLMGALIACACALLPAAPASAASAAKGVVAVLGEAQGGVREGLFMHPDGIAVNQNSGDFYVADTKNDRIQQFTSSGEFVRAWGAGVAMSGPDALNTDEVVSLSVVATGGSYTLNYAGIKIFGKVFGGYTSGPIAYDAQASAVQAALEALPPFAQEGGTVTVTGGPGDASGSKPYEITFGGTLSGVENTFTPLTTELSGTATATVTTHAMAPFEICSAEKGDTCRAGMKSSIGGGMSEPIGVAVEQAHGNVYVTDEANHRIDVYSEDGAFEGAFGWGVSSGGSALEFCTSTCEAGKSGSGAGELGSTIGSLAYDPKSGNIYVADPANRRVDEFGITLTAGEVSGATFVRGYGWGASSGAAEFQVCTSTCHAANTASGTNAGQFGSASPTQVAVDDQGNVYALDAANSRVQKFSATAEPVGAFASAQLSGAPAVSGIAINPATDAVLAVRACTATACPEASVSSESRIYEFNTAGTLLATYGSGEGLGAGAGVEVKGLAAGGPGGGIYMSTSGSAEGEPQQLLVLGTIVPPVLAIAAPTVVEAHEATLHGSVNPSEVAANQLQTQYQFEVSVEGSTWVKVGTAANVAASKTPVAVTQTITGLEASTHYRVRLHAEKEYASGSATSATTEFQTSSAPPSVLGQGASNVEAASALIFATVNPEGAETTYRVEYGTSTAYGVSLPASNAEMNLGAAVAALPISVHPEGLLPGTLYYYRVVAENARGEGEATGTFTTSEATLPSVSTSSAAGVAQNVATIGGVVDTRGQAVSYGFEVGTAPGEYGPATGLGYLGAGLGETAVSLGLTGLAPGTTYYYRVSASDVYGTSYGAVRSFTTAVFQSAQVVPPAPLPFVSVPSIAFPTQAGGTAGKGKVEKKTRRHRGRAHSRRRGSKRCARQARAARGRRAACKKRA